MTITRWFPRMPMIDFSREAERFFDSLPWNEDFNFRHFSPAVDIEEQPQAYVVAVELPGVRKEDVKISLKDNLLSISGEKKSEKKVERKDYQQSERIYGKFQRCFRLPELVDQEKINAEFSNGVLNIVIPKLAEAQPKEIEIQVK